VPWRAQPPPLEDYCAPLPARPSAQPPAKILRAHILRSGSGARAAVAISFDERVIALQRLSRPAPPWADEELAAVLPRLRDLDGWQHAGGRPTRLEIDYCLRAMAPRAVAILTDGAGCRDRPWPALSPVDTDPRLLRGRAQPPVRPTRLRWNETPRSARLGRTSWAVCTCRRRSARSKSASSTGD
jgi:hypothetical protein